MKHTKMTSGKKIKKNKRENPEPEINFVSGNDFYIYELLLGEMPLSGQTEENKIKKYNSKKIINKLKNQIKSK